MASFAFFETRNFTTRLAGILISSPVAGLRPMRALRFTRTSLPTPGIVKLFFASLYASAVRSSRNCVEIRFVVPVDFDR